MPELDSYRKKRDPRRTPEPFGETSERRALPPGAPRLFIVQQHDARRMHWDLRLEIDGVLVSWAIPRGPTLHPKEKRLAVRTEDHPIEYGDFEGVIPEGSYGAGPSLLWDRGAYVNVDGRSPSAGLAAGKLDLLLDGHALRGRFALVQTKEGGRHWLLLRKGQPPPPGTPELVESHVTSVLSGLRVDELAHLEERRLELAELARAAEASGARERALQERDLKPMFAGTAEAPFSKDGWIFEPKHDGMRCLAVRRGADVKLVSRRGRDVTTAFPEIRLAVSHLPASDLALDGEIVAVDERGRSSFQRLQRRFGDPDPWQAERLSVEVPVHLEAFDLLSLEGFDLRRVPLVERKRLLDELAPRVGFIRYVDHVEREGVALFEAAAEHGLEGVMGKKADSPYESGRRSKCWLKVKAPRTTRCVVVGWLAGKASRQRLGSLVLGWWKDGVLVHAGNVGSGLDDETIDELLPQLESLATNRSPLDEKGGSLTRGARWVKPELCCEVRHSDLTGAALLRHPVFAGVVDDCAPEDCLAPGTGDEEPGVGAASSPSPSQSTASPSSKRSTSKSAARASDTAPATPRLELTRLDKVFFPESGLTKGDLLAYHEAAWPWLEPYLRDRPVVLTRYPDGIDGKSFFQQNAPAHAPSWIPRARIDGTDFFVADRVEALLWMINSGAIPLHVWSSRRTDPDRPDWTVLDLDPKEAPFEDVVAAARCAHRILESIDAPHFIKTSGQSGLHVVLPLDGRLDHDGARQLAQLVAQLVHAELPDTTTLIRPIAARGKRVYLDCLQNGRGKLVVAPLSVRPRPGAPVSFPLRWSQVTSRLDPSRWTIRNAVKELEKKGDPLAEVLGGDVDVEAMLEGLAGLA